MPFSLTSTVALAVTALLLLVSTPPHAHADTSVVECRYDGLQRVIFGDGIGRSHTATVQRRQAPAADDEWRPIRILVSTGDLDNETKYCTAVGQSVERFIAESVSCTEADILTADKRDILLNYLIPEAIKLHADRLKVQPLESIKVPKFGESDFCSKFEIPEEHQTTGVTGYDYVLYVTSVPLPLDGVGWGTDCARAQDNGNRPVVGVVNVAPAFINRSDADMRFVAHQIMHALGFSSYYFEEKKMTTMETIRGVRSSPAVVSNNVVQRMGNHFGCDTVPGMELEPFTDVAGSHWKLRNAKDELMCGYTSAGRYTAISIAAMEDLGYYKGIYEKAEFMNWGFQAGCGLLTDKCVKNGVTQVPTMFCESPDEPLTCTSLRDGRGDCIVREYYTPFPTHFQYFSNPALGGIYTSADYCPLRFNTRLCESPAEKCVDFAEPVGQVAGLCVKIQCNEAAATYEVQGDRSTEWVACPAGESVEDVLPLGAVIKCPPFREMCPTVFNSLDIRVKVGLPDSSDNALRGPHAWLAAAIVVSLAVTSAFAL